jgi:ABC-type transport system substrate-binding protein
MRARFCSRTRNGRLALIASLVVILSFGLAACASDADPGASGQRPSTPTGTLRVGIAGQLQTLDPTLSVQIFETPMVTALYDGLLTRKPKSYDELSPALATSYESNADASEWTFKLREGVKFSDGATFDSTAAKKSLEYYARDGSVLSFAMGPLDKISTPDPSTLVVKFKQTFPDFGSYTPLLKMISPKLLTGGTADEIAKRVGSTAAGTGPYVVDSFSGGGLKAHANPDYWGDGPYIKNLDFVPIPEESARNAALQAGDVDLLMAVSPRTAQTFESDSRLTVTSVQSWQNFALNLATQKAPLNDVRVRQALSYAIDREAIAKSVLLGKAEVSGSLEPPGTYGYQKPETQYTYDPGKSKELLAAAGVAEPVKLNLVVFDSVADGRLIADALADQAKEAGFDLNVSVVPAAAAASDVAKPQRKYDIYLFVEGAVNGGPFHLAAGVITGNASYDGKELLDLIAKVNATPNGPEREEAIAQALEQGARDVPEIPLFSIAVTDASVDTLKDHVPSRDGFLPDWTEQWLNGG